jgi:hypothetical protein
VDVDVDVHGKETHAESLCESKAVELEQCKSHHENPKQNHAELDMVNDVARLVISALFWTEEIHCLVVDERADHERNANPEVDVKHVGSDCVGHGH